MVPKLDDDQAALIAAIRAQDLPEVREDLAATRARQAAGVNRDGVAVAMVEDHVVDGPHGPLLIRRYAASPDPGRAAFVFFHGGGMVAGSVEFSDALCRRLCAESGVSVFSVDYRLAPEYRFPVATDEAYFATGWVIANATQLGIDADRVAVGGDSSGGSLAAGVTLQLRDKAGPALRLQVLIYPGLERSEDSPSMLEYGDGPSLTRANIDWMKEQYLGSDAALDTPYGVPALAEHLQDLPEAVVVVAEADPLRDGGEAYAERLFAAGVQTTVLRYPGLVHGFLSNFTRLRRADRCVSDIAAVLRHALARPGEP